MSLSQTNRTFCLINILPSFPSNSLQFSPQVFHLQSFEPLHFLSLLRQLFLLPLFLPLTGFFPGTLFSSNDRRQVTRVSFYDGRISGRRRMSIFDSQM